MRKIVAVPPDADQTAPLPQIAELTGSFRRGEATPVDILDRCRSRIALFNPTVRAIVDLIPNASDAALASSRRWRLGKPWSAIDGVPIAIKANIAVAGRGWTDGCEAYRDRVAIADAGIVAALRADGAIIVGITNMDEAALGASGDNRWLGPTSNPRAPGRAAGGSSGGSAAAVAAGMCVAAFGTDTIGSIRIPAAYCGVTGYKPQRGVLGLDGVTPLAPMLDSLGILARSVADVGALLAATSKYRVSAAPPTSLNGRRIAVFDWADRGPLAPAVAAAAAKAVGSLRAAGAGLSSEPLDGVDLYQLGRRSFMLAEIDGAAVHADALRSTPHGFSPALAAMFGWGARQDGARRTALIDEIGSTAARIERTLDRYDALILPSVPTPAPRVDEAPRDQAVFTAIASCLGWSAIVLPCGVTEGDHRGGPALPLSVQLIAREDATCLSIAASLEAGIDCH